MYDPFAPIVRHGRLALAACSLLLLVVACSEDEPSASSTTGAGGGAPCTGTEGVLGGVIFRMTDPAPQALAQLRQTAQDMPLQVQADDSGHYEVTLEAGSWLAGAEDGQYCETLADEEAVVTACETTVLDLHMDCVLGGGGAAGAGGAGGAGGY